MNLARVLSNFDHVEYPKVITDLIAEVLRRQDEVIDAACHHALVEGCTVHVYPNPHTLPDWRGETMVFSHYIGIAFTEGPVKIVWHTAEQRFNG